MNETPQDRAARRTATATWWIAIFSIVAAAVGISQAIITHRQLDVMERTLAREQRPTLDVVQLVFDAAPQANSPLTGRMTVINRGEVKAEILGGGRASYITMAWSKDLPSQNAVTPGAILEFAPCDARAGEKYPAMLQGSQTPWCFKQLNPVIGPDDLQKIKTGQDGMKLWVGGIIIYWDGQGSLHTTLLCRKYDPASGRLDRVEDKECNYSY